MHIIIRTFERTLGHIFELPVLVVVPLRPDESTIYDLRQTLDYIHTSVLTNFSVRIMKPIVRVTTVGAMGDYFDNHQLFERWEEEATQIIHAFCDDREKTIA